MGISQFERKQRIKKLVRDFCNKCHRPIAPDGSECKDCWVRWIMNEIMENGK